jgi:hypothetical protein
MVAEVLASIGPALGRCARDGCSNFAARLGHTRYCSPACARRAITKRYNAKHRAEIIARKRRVRAEKRTLQLSDAIPSQRRARRLGSRSGEPARKQTRRTRGAEGARLTNAPESALEPGKPLGGG